MFLLKFPKLSSAYFIICFLGLVGYWIENIPLSIVFRSLGLLILLYYYWKHVKEENQLLFYLSIALVAVGEALIVYGFEHSEVQVPVILLFIGYYWCTIFLIKKTVREPKIKYKRINWAIFILVLLLIGYLAYNFVNMMFIEMGNTLLFVIGSILSFSALCVYSLLIYFSKRSFRNFWLLLLVTAIILAQSTVPLEAMYFSSVQLKTIGFVAEILSHYFVFQYLITPEDEIVLEDSANYL